MAWRIDEQLIRGEIDNRTRGRVTGRLWFTGVDEPVVLDLAGNAWRDLAGRRLEFVNPDPKPFPPPGLRGFPLLQRGTTGDISASRKVRVPDIPMDQIGEYYAAKKPFPWHWGNSLYLEWYGEANGRVVIESASYTLTISTDSAWEMTPAEEDDQRRANAAGMTAFLDAATQALAAAEASGEFTVEDLGTDDLVAPDAANDDADSTDDVATDGPGNETKDLKRKADHDDDDRPVPTEEEAERRHAQSERLTDRVTARLAREGPEADLRKIVAEETERARKERGEPELTPEQKAERSAWIEEITRAAADDVAFADAAEKQTLPRPDASADNDDDDEDDFAFDDSDDGSDEDDDFDDEDDPSRKHPLSRRAFALSVRVLQDIDANAWEPADDAAPEHPVTVLIGGVTSAGAKFAGALDDVEWPPRLAFCADTIVRLKRAAGYLDDARLALESCREEGLTTHAWLDGISAEVAALTAGTDALIAELRTRLAGGT